MVKLNDLFIGDFPVTQLFGEHPENYIQFGLKGHNGVDLGVPTGTSLLNPFPKESEVVVSYVGNDPNGYGTFIRLWDKTQQCVVLYAHCQEIKVKVGDSCFFQEEVAISNNTGNSSGPHLHFGFYLVDKDGNKYNKDNGYDGCLNPMDPSLVTWTILNPKAPATPIQTVTIPAEEHTKLVTNSDNYERVCRYLKLLIEQGKALPSSDKVITQIEAETKETVVEKEKIVEVPKKQDSLDSFLDNVIDGVVHIKDILYRLLKINW